MEIAIYQVNMGRDHNRIAFQGFDGLERFQGTSEIDSEIYDKVFEGEVSCENLEDVWRTCRLGSEFSPAQGTYLMNVYSVVKVRCGVFPPHLFAATRKVKISTPLFKNFQKKLPIEFSQ